MKRARYKSGSVVLDKRSKCWNFFWWADGKRRSKQIGSLRDFPTKASAWKQAERIRQSLEMKTNTGSTALIRGIVQQVVDDVKTDDSRKTLTIAGELLEVLKLWKQTTEFSAPEDWIFASPVQIGRLPYSYTGVKETLQRAADAAGIGHLRSHTFRHSYRTWLDSVGTPVGVQQKLMRHSDIRTTMNIYGDVATPDMREASGKVAMLVLNGRKNGMEDS